MALGFKRFNNSDSLESPLGGRLSEGRRSLASSPPVTSEDLRVELQSFAEGALKDALADMRQNVHQDILQELRELRKGPIHLETRRASDDRSHVERDWHDGTEGAKSTSTTIFQQRLQHNRPLKRGLTLRSFASQGSVPVTDFFHNPSPKTEPASARKATAEHWDINSADGYAPMHPAMPAPLSRESSNAAPEIGRQRPSDLQLSDAIDETEEQHFEDPSHVRIIRVDTMDDMWQRAVRFKSTDGLLGRHSISNTTRSESQASFAVKRSGRIEALVEGEVLANVAGIMVVLNSILLGLEVDYGVKGLHGHMMLFLLLDFGFCIFFTVEISLRIFVHGMKYFTGAGWEWNLFDLLMLLVQWIDQIIHWIAIFNAELKNLGIMRALRMLTLLRVTRFFRAFHLFKDLHVIVNSMSAACESLIWSLLLQLMTIYVWGVVFMEVVSGNEEFREDETLQFWFGSLGRSMLTMFECVLSGVSWDVVVRPLITHFSPAMGVVFVVYIAVSLFAMMNLVTGLFVTEVTNKVREDKDESLAQSIRDLFNEMGADGIDDEITREVFLRHLLSEPMQKYLKSLDVHPSEAWRIFDILDVDGRGALDCNEMLQGFLRLRGPARSLDMSVLRREIADLGEELLGKLDPPSFLPP